MVSPGLPITVNSRKTRDPVPARGAVPNPPRLMSPVVPILNVGGPQEADTVPELSTFVAFNTELLYEITD